MSGDNINEKAMKVAAILILGLMVGLAILGAGFAFHYLFCP